MQVENCCQGNKNTKQKKRNVNKFNRYLKGKEFLIESDHRPLQVLNKVNPVNPRIMRWGLMLQGYIYFG